MLSFYNTEFSDACQAVPEEKNYIIDISSSQKTSDVKCSSCNGKVYVYDHAVVNLTDVPYYPMTRTRIRYRVHRYRCTCCGKTFTETIPDQYPGTRITRRAAQWILALLLGNCTISCVQRILGIHWETIRRVHKEYMEKKVSLHDQMLRDKQRKPRFLAVDEFAIHKGHRYATCVLDLETGHVIWVGKGRAKADFQHFFDEIDMDFLTDVQAIAMDMNASYNLLVQEHLPDVKIVYDRYHMQAQFGKDVLGQVRLDAARAHKKKASELKVRIEAETDREERARLKEAHAEEKRLYRQTKNSRWDVLRNSATVPQSHKATLKEILDRHEDLAICYAMKEEMRELFLLTDPKQAELRWRDWFEAAQNSGVAALEAFAARKEKRIRGLIAHAEYPISTGPLEGLNNKIKVAKRIAYGYRDEEYFFTLIRYLTIPEIRKLAKGIQ